MNIGRHIQGSTLLKIKVAFKFCLSHWNWDVSCLYRQKKVDYCTVDKKVWNAIHVQLHLTGRKDKFGDFLAFMELSVCQSQLIIGDFQAGIYLYQLCGSRFLIANTDIRLLHFNKFNLCSVIFLFRDERFWERKEESFWTKFAAFKFDVAQRLLTFYTRLTWFLE